MSRPDRVAELIKIEVSEILRKHVDNPRIGFVTITKVKIDADLKDAIIYVSVYGNEVVKEDSMRGLESAKRFIRGMLGDKLNLKFVPTIAFVFDDSIEKSSKIWNLMQKINEKNS